MQKQLTLLAEETQSDLLKKSKSIGQEWLKAKQKSEMKKLTLFSFLFVGAVAGRVALQFVPSVEPIIPIAILAAVILGPKEGFSIGAGAYVASNFLVWGLQGPWTLFQAVGAGVPAVVAGLVLKSNRSEKAFLLAAVLGTVFFEIIMNLFGSVSNIGLFGLGLLSIPIYFLTSAPFSIAHIVSNLVFARALSPLLLKLREKDNELEIIRVRRVDGGRTTDIGLYKPR